LLLYLCARPLWLGALLIVVAPAALAMPGPSFVRKRVSLSELAQNNEIAGFKFARLPARVSARSRHRGAKAMTLAGAPEPCAIFIGRAMTTVPVGGNWSRLARFSRPATLAAPMMR
jgi:hypothetical protein